MKILEIGPSPIRSKGGMASVISGIQEDVFLNSRYCINIHESYCDGHIVNRFLFSAKAFIKFIKIYKKYDIFHIHMASYGSTFRKGYYIRFLKKHNKKIILHVHGAEYLQFYDGITEQKRQLVRKIWKLCDAVIVLSNEWKKQFEAIFDIDTIKVVENGINAEQYIKGRGDIAKYRESFLFLGRLGTRKGAYDIIEAVEKLTSSYPQLKVFMAGDGEVNQIKKIIERKELYNIEVIGWVDFEKKIKLFHQTGTLLLPSYHEGLPMAILEGMAAGKVIISTEVGGIPEIIQNDKNGILIHPGDINALCGAMIKVMTDPTFDLKCGKNNLKEIESQYSRKNMHEKLSHIFDNMAGK